jgi:hypothetical protein
MGGAPQRLFPIHLCQAPQEKALQAPGFLGLAKHRFRNRLALGVDLVPGIEVAATKLTDAAVIWLLIARQHPNGQILVTCTLDLVPFGTLACGQVGGRRRC